MGYGLEFYRLSLTALGERLRTSAGAATQLIASGGGVADEAAVIAVVQTVRDLAEPLDLVEHASSGGDWFRDEVLAGPVAAGIGTELAEYLLERPLAGLSWDEYPCVGWATNAELQDALSRLDALGHDPADALGFEEATVVRTVFATLRKAAADGGDLATVYA